MFGELAAAHRRRLGLTQEGVAAATGLSVRSIRDLEAGRVAQPRPSTVRLLADAYGLVDADRAAFVRAAQPGPPAGAQPRQLPLGVPRFVGRDDQLAVLDATLDDPTGVAVVAVSGMAGIGKTALALHWAHRVAGRFPDGHLYVNLRGFDEPTAILDPADVLRGFLEALGVPLTRIPVSAQARVGLYRSLLAARRMLIVLDNARDSEHARPLLPGTGGCVVVVTSRDKLSDLVAVECARPLTLDVLTAAESRGLLAARLGTQRLAAEPDAVGDIVAATGQLPLALSIVAARVAVHPGFALDAVAAELGSAQARLDALADGNVRRAFSWSYLASSPPAARLFRLLGLHPGPDVTADAAAALAGVTVAEVAPLLRELTRLHLLAQQAPGRYDCHDLLRTYATELAESVESAADRQAARHRLFDHYLHTAFPAAVTLQPQWTAFDPVAPLAGNASRPPAGHDAALAFFAAEHAMLLRLVRLAADTGFDAYAWQLAWTLTTFYAPRGLWQGQLAAQEVALAAARRAGSVIGQAIANRLLSRAATRLGQHDLAEERLRRALQLHEQLDDHSGQAQTLHNYAELCYIRGRPDEGLAHGLAALRLYQLAGNRAGEARTLNAVGWLYAATGDYRQAIESCTDALARQRELGDRNGQAATLDSLGYAYDKLGEHDRAASCFEDAVRMFRESADRYHEAETLVRLGEARQSLADLPAAVRAWRRAVEIFDDLGDPAADDARRRLATVPDPTPVPDDRN